MCMIYHRHTDNYYDTFDCRIHLTFQASNRDPQLENRALRFHVTFEIEILSKRQKIHAYMRYHSADKGTKIINSTI